MWNKQGISRLESPIYNVRAMKYEEIFAKLQEYDPEELTKAILLRCKDDLLTDFTKAQRDEVINAAYAFYYESDLPSCVDERILDEMEIIASELLDNAESEEMENE